mmetsp:Transcript_46693/g.77265  ORF Transcript_46693/g.77265 Transcript_46693/m.77265 type:complete len:258 (-) Transcript_46693:39-812(-)
MRQPVEVPRLAIAQLRIGSAVSAESHCAQSARDGRERDLCLTDRPYTARCSVGITPRGRAMLGPRPDDAIRIGIHDTIEPMKHVKCAVTRQRGLEDVRPTGPIGCASNKQSTALQPTDWLLAAKTSVKAVAGTPLTDWLWSATGADVHVLEPDGAACSSAVLLGPQTGPIQCDTSANTTLWRVKRAGAPPQLVHAANLRCTRPAQGDIALAVLGTATGFLGKVLNVDGDIAVVKSESRAVKALPMDALCRKSTFPQS